MSALDIDSQLSPVRSTWGTFDRLLGRSDTFRRNTNVAFDETVPAAQRLTALQKLRDRLNEDPARQLIRERLARDAKAATWMDEFSIQLAIFSTRAFDFFTPAHSRHHILFIPLVCLVAGYIFSFMAGGYPSTFAQTTCLRSVPVNMLRWFGGSVGAPGWCLPGASWEFSARYLRTWGGRYNPDLRMRCYEWITGPFIHKHFIHLFSNIMLLLIIGCEVEKRYGQPRTVLLFVLTMLGGSLLSAVAEAKCAVIVGLSGVVFGFLPLYTLDIVKHWKDMTAPALQVFFFIVFFITFGASIIRQPTGISHMSHVGGLLLGIFPALLFQYHILPHHDDTESVHHLRVHPRTLERLEMVVPIVTTLVMCSYFFTTFMVFYLHTFPALDCPAF